MPTRSRVPVVRPSVNPLTLLTLLTKPNTVVYVRGSPARPQAVRGFPLGLRWVEMSQLWIPAAGREAAAVADFHAIYSMFCPCSAVFSVCEGWRSQLSSRRLLWVWILGSDSRCCSREACPLCSSSGSSRSFACCHGNAEQPR